MLGINRYTLRSWRDKRRKGEPLLLETTNKPSKWSKDDKDEIIKYYFSHGKSVTNACRKFGYPSASSLKLWIRKD